MTLAGYNEIDPTFAERVVSMAELDQRYRLDAIERTSKAEAFAVTAGMTSMIVLSLVSLIAAVILIFLGHPEGVGLLALPIMEATPRFIAALRAKPGDD